MQSNRRRNAQSARLRYMVMIAMFMAMTYVTMLLLRIKVPPFLTLDVKDTVTTLCGLFLGPVAALIIAVAVPMLEFFVSDTGFYGLIMNTLGSVSFCVTVALFYKWKKTIWGAVAGLVSGALLMTGVMLLANVFITPHYLVLMMNMELGIAKMAVRDLLAPTLLPFNLLKGFLNVGLVLLLYKPLSRALRKLNVIARKETPVCEAGAAPASAAAGAECENPTASPRKKHISLWVTLAAVVLIVAAVVLIFKVMGGSVAEGGGKLGAIVDAVEHFLVDKLGRVWGVIICSMLPIIELRGAIPLGMGLQLPWWQSYIFAVIGNMIPVPFILLFITKIIAWMQKCKIKLFNRFAGWLMNKAEKNRERIEKYSFWGVGLFVAIPLPVTGAWTGSLVAAVIDMKFWKALLSCFIGVLIAGAIVTAIAYGGLAAFQFLL